MSFIIKEKNECNLQEPSNEFSFLEPTELSQEVIQMEHEHNFEQEREVGPENEEEENSLTNEQVEEISQSDEQLEEDSEEVPLRRSSRKIQPSIRLRDFLTYKVQYPI
jgi:hypothetical protein